MSALAWYDVVLVVAWLGCVVFARGRARKPLLWAFLVIFVGRFLAAVFTQVTIT